MLVNVRDYWWTLFDEWILDSGGDIELVVASNKEVKISPIREAFQEIFGEATVE